MSWRKVRLGKFLNVRPGKYKPTDPAIAGLKRVDKIDFSGRLHLSDKGSNTDMILVKQGDLLISGINVAKGAVIVYEGSEDIIATVHYSNYTFDEEQIDITFLKLFLQSPEFFDAIREQIPGGIKTEIKSKHLLPLEVIIPDSTDEQRKVAEAFFTYQAKQHALGDELNYQLAHLTQLRQALLREAMQGHLLPQDPTDEPAAVLLQQLQVAAKPGKKGRNQDGALFAEEVEAVEGLFTVPNSWLWCRLNQMAAVSSGSTPKPDAFIEGRNGVPYLKMYNLVNQKVDFEYRPQFIKEEVHNQLLKRSIARPGDVLMNIVGPPLGKIAIVPDTFPEWNTNQAVVVINSGEASVNKWVYWFLREGSAIATVELRGMAGQDNISVNQTRAFPIPLPPLTELHRIVLKLEQLFQHCDALEQRIRESRRLAEQLLATALREALAPPTGIKPTEEAELELVEAETTSAAPRRGRPRKPVLQHGDQMSLDGLFN